MVEIESERIKTIERYGRKRLREESILGERERERESEREREREREIAGIESE